MRVRIDWAFAIILILILVITGLALSRVAKADGGDESYAPDFTASLGLNAARIVIHHADRMATRKGCDVAALKRDSLFWTQGGWHRGYTSPTIEIDAHSDRHGITPDWGLRLAYRDDANGVEFHWIAAIDEGVYWLLAYHCEGS